ncbi:hypothetical protein TELCIR_01701 [Teladorsagia circumcincta]|uniref:Uncharacterized protein n=1 Tax=Teladorsagia circumcincta TaxID=45464 RepID=A0A2G9V2N2_TELCI|nr:hypothetical protein TELCIR_01701 [Teladorsagia circumcincta]
MSTVSLPSELREDWLGEKLIECRHSGYGYTIVEWILMIAVLALSIAVCVASYLAKAYADGHYQLLLLVDSLPSKELVKRYNRYSDSREDDRTPENRTRTKEPESTQISAQAHKPENE